MGLLSEGSPLSWEETQALADHVRKHGVIQFINLYQRLKFRQGDILKWGDEVEYIIVKFDHNKKTAKVSLVAKKLLDILNEKESRDPTGVKSLWRPEYGAYMIEGTPGKPYGGLPAHLNIVEANMRYRREEAQELLGPDEVIFSITNFPRLGCLRFTDPFTSPNPIGGASRSLFLPDSIIFPGHPRFATLTRNIRMRRGEKVAINIPIYRDVNTPNPFIEDLSQYGDDGSSQKASLPNHVYMDAMGFGMGCCCLQVTFQACNIDEAKTLYDQLTPLCPIMLALTAASPIFRGYLTDVDCRWNVIASSVDCRTREERGLEELKNNKFVIPKSRYDSIDSYLSPEHGDKYNDIPLIYDENIYNQLVQSGIDSALSKHIAHLFIRDTVSLFSEKVDQNDETDTDHFENIQSTNWQTMRFKPPPPNSSIGWRVEFRPCETQLTDFENAAFVCFVVLLTRIILSYQLNFIIPISKVDENMKRAQKRDALHKEKFWFRKNCSIKTNHNGTNMDDFTKQNGASNHFNSETMFENETPKQNGGVNVNNQELDDEEEYVEMTINEIVNGKEGVFPGLVPLVSRYLISMDVDVDTHCTVKQYLKLISNRASGDILTTASWIRNFVTSHKSYGRDSIVSEEITYDLLMAAHKIQTGQQTCPQLLGKCLISKSKTRESIPIAVSKQYNCTDR